jgi:hypothetical protein
MNDLDQLREFRAELPHPERTRLAPGRSRLLSAARRPPRRRFSAPHRNTRLLLPATAAATAVAVAVGLAGYALSTGGAPPAHSSRASAPPKRPAAVSQAVLAARVLRDASEAASRVPPKATPNPGQWIYAKTVQYDYQEGVSSAGNWITFDGTKSAYYEDPGGPLIVHTSPMSPPSDIKSDPLAAFNAQSTPQTAYYALASLPTAPRQLLAAAAAAGNAFGAANLGGTPVASGAPRNKGQLEFDYLSLLVWNAAGGVGAPPTAEAAVFRAMAAIPGVTVQQGITDAAGAAAIGVSDDGGYNQILLDPVSYQVIGLRQLSTGPNPDPITRQELAKFPKAEQQYILRRLKDAPPGPRKGTLIESLAYAQVSEVSGPGVK